VTRSRDIAVLAATGCEGFAAVALLHGVDVPAFALHAAACGSAAALLHRRLLQGPPGWSFVLIFASTLFVPMLGALGLIAVALGTPAPESLSEAGFVRTRIPRPPGPDLDEASRPPDADAPAGGRQRRVEAVTALRGRTDPESISQLRRGLEDCDEDVRLLAHALIESKSRAASRSIDETTRALEEAPEARRGPIHRRLALQCWDLAWLGLVQGECLDHALGTARHHAVAALEHDPGSPSLHFLLGRIDLRLNAPERAEAALIRSRELGFPGNVVRPYLAEAAFLRRRFDLVRTYLAEPGPAGPSGIAARLRRYWT
jgi:polysaccharide biosynthesis protein PelE